MQGRALNGHAANVDWLQQGPGIDRAGAPDVHVDSEQARSNLRGRILERDGPARIARHRAQLLLMMQIVDLDDDPIDLVGQIEALALPLFAILHHLVQVPGPLNIRVDREAPFADQFQGFPLALDLHTLDIPDLVAKEIKLAAGGDTCVLLAQ